MSCPRSSRLACALLTLCLGCGCSCSDTGDDSPRVPGKQTFDFARNCGPGPFEADTSSPGMFVDITEESGLDFQRVVGPLGTYFLPEINGSGGAMFDCDGDGDLDIYLVNSGRSPKGVGELPGASRLENRLFLNDGQGHFRDGTKESGLGDTSYGLGCAIGDVDNDGDPDVFVCNYGRDRLFLNDGKGHFRDVTEQSGLTTAGWSTSAAFCDYDRDGWLDLFITCYGSETFDAHKRACDYGGGHVGYCSPLEFDQAADVLLHNMGTATDGVTRFEDVSKRAGISETRATGFCVVCADFDGDTWPDFYVANDMYANRLWINQKNGTFKDLGMQSGSALNYLGRGEASMGLALGDVDSDGDFDILSTHFTDETNTLYINDRGDFRDATEQWQLGLASRRHTGWGVWFVDLDHDGFLDIPLVNGLALPCHWRSSDQDRQGAIIDLDELTKKGQATVEDPQAYWAEYADRNQVFFNTGQGQFVDRTTAAGDFSATPASGRGLICGDIDGDGDIDLLVTFTGGRARLYRNDVPKQGHWLQIRAIDPEHRRDAYGAEIVVVAGEHRHHRILNPAGSYLASHDPRVHVGLAGDHYDRIEVRWPDGDTAWESFPGGSANRVVALRRKKGAGNQGE